MSSTPHHSGSAPGESKKRHISGVWRPPPKAATAGVESAAGAAAPAPGAPRFTVTVSGSNGRSVASAAPGSAPAKPVHAPAPTPVAAPFTVAAGGAGGDTRPSKGELPIKHRKFATEAPATPTAAVSVRPPPVPTIAAPAPAPAPGHAHPHGHHHGHHHGHATAAAAGGGSGIDKAFLSDVKWTDPSIASVLSDGARRALSEAFRFEFLSKVQAATLPLLLRGEDCFAKAKTGGGKTVGFLLPAVERLLSSRRAGAPGTIGILVVSPTRELALQTLEEAKILTRFQPGIRVAAVIGGTNINGERGRIGGKGGAPSLDILIATPGRCVDHLESTPGFREALGRASVVVLDEADRLLDMGFEAQLNAIRDALPPASAGRQTLLFSATVPEAVKKVAHRFLRVGYPMVDTVGEDDTATNPQVVQEALVLPSASVIPALARVLAHIAANDPSHKVVVFFTTARVVGYFASIFEALALPGGRRLNIVEMHSRKSQGARTAAADKFRSSRGAIVMFSSDVSARGMDYPDITHVIQVGLTDREQYIHRLGRTARAGKSGVGLLILADYEARPLLRELADIPITLSMRDSAVTGGAVAGLEGHPRPDTHPIAPAAAIAAFPPLTAALASVGRDEALLEEADRAYSASLGFYKGALRRIGWRPVELVAEMNALWLTLGCPRVPTVPVDTLGKMGLRGTPGLKEGPPHRGGGGGGGRGGGFGGRGGRGGRK